MRERGIAWERLASMLFCILVLGAFLFLGARYLLPASLPFFVAWLLSLGIRPLAARISQKTKIPVRPCAAALLVLFLAILILLIGFLAGRLMEELTRLLAQLLENGGAILWVKEETADPLRLLLERLGVHWENTEYYAKLQEMIHTWLDSLGARLVELLSNALPRVAGWMLSSLPSVLLAALITVMAGFYFCMDGEAVLGGLARLLPVRLREKLPRLRRRAGEVGKCYLRVYLILLGLTFLELLVGFLILRVQYALLLAALIALVDLLPILGVGTILLPWAVVAFFQKNFYLGFGLCVLYLAILILRQVLEPRLVGKSLGLHPLLALFAAYVGWQLLGFWGMALGPVAALLLRSLVMPFWNSFSQANPKPNTGA